MGLLIVLSLLTSVVVDVGLTDGTRIRGELNALSPAGVSLIAAAGGRPQQLPRESLDDIVFVGDGTVPRRNVLVQLIDDSIVPCDAIVLGDGKLTGEVGRGRWSAADSSVRAVRWPLPGEKGDEQWSEILRAAGSEDLLVIRREKNLDYLKGAVLGVTKDAVQFDFSGSTIPVPFAKAAGIILARKSQTPAAPRLRLATRDGARWMCRSAVLESAQIKVVSMANVVHTIPLEEILKIDFPQMGVVFLTDLEPESIHFRPFIGSQLEATLSKLHAPQANRTEDGRKLRVKDPTRPTGVREFRHGLALQSRTDMVYRLAGKYQRFLATAGMDPQATSLANVDFTLWGDEDEIYTKSIAKSDRPVEINCDVSGVRRLRITVDYGGNLHIGDRLHLGDARLAK